MISERIGKTQSPLEIAFLENCAVVGLLVEPQYLIGGIHADFALPKRKIVFEVDSKQWHSSEESKLEDEKRNHIYWENGWRVVRIFAGAILGNECEDILYKIKVNDDLPKLSLIYRGTSDECDDD